MNVKAAVRLLVPGLVLMVLGSAIAARAAGPWGNMLGIRTVEADPKKPYALKEDNGPWMIMTCSFSGPRAEQQAHELVFELRQRYKLEAYAYRKGFKLDDPNGGRGADPLGSPVRWQYKKFKNRTEIDETAVLVGNYPSVDDAEARRSLQTLKYAQPDCLKPAAGKPTSQDFAGFRAIQEYTREKYPNIFEQKQYGPMGHAFVTTNPLLPADYFAPRNGIDELVLKMNKGVTHSLLDCPGRYTVQVAHFIGKVTIIVNQAQPKDMDSGDKPGESALYKGAEKAHKLTEELRALGYDAYEFHDRYASIVTVGSFNSVGTPRPDGKIEINPRIHAIMKTFGAKPREFPGGRKGELVKQTLVGIGFDLQPIPVEVPKRSISRELAQGL
jgi:hypothetical protein